MTTSHNQPWLVGSNGVFQGHPEGDWHRIGTFDYHINAIVDRRKSIIAGVNCGVWEIDPKTGSWTQLHDETVTEVLTVASYNSDSKQADLIIGCPYGIAVNTSVEHEAHRWSFYSDDLRVNERFTTSILSMSAAGTFLIGTEAGVLTFDSQDIRFSRTSLTGFPVRSLINVNDTYFAGTDAHGIWSSRDGETWHLAGLGVDDHDILSLTYDGEQVVAGTDRGVLIGSGTGHWHSRGPAVLISSIASDPDGSGRWLAGCEPGGLWWTEDTGTSFKQIGNFNSIGAIVAPGEYSNSNGEST